MLSDLGKHTQIDPSAAQLVWGIEAMTGGMNTADKVWRFINGINSRFFKQSSLVQPAATLAHLQAALAPQKTIKRPQLKGNVFHTLKEIVAIFMADWNRAKASINLAIILK
jgi:hypothetical protein